MSAQSSSPSVFEKSPRGRPGGDASQPCSATWEPWLRPSELRDRLWQYRDRADQLGLPLSMLVCRTTAAQGPPQVDAAVWDQLPVACPALECVDHFGGPIDDGRWALILADIDADRARQTAGDVATYLDQRGVEAQIAVETYEPDQPGVRADGGTLNGYPLGEYFFRDPPWWKRWLDLAGGGLGIVLCAPLFALVACYIKIVSRGPVLYTQERIGARGKSFKIVKFRTMHVANNAAEHREYVKSLANDPDAQLRKIDPCGALLPGAHWLRATGIDELPQLFNVLRGEMSLVGPRPDVLPIEAYRQAELRRFDVLPGMTGLWQVSGKNETTFAEMMELDIDYVKRRSFLLDLKIFATTPIAVLQQSLGRVDGKVVHDHA